MAADIIMSITVSIVILPLALLSTVVIVVIVVIATRCTATIVDLSSAFDGIKRLVLEQLAILSRTLYQCYTCATKTPLHGCKVIAITF